jgi:hypothetical protein
MFLKIKSAPGIFKEEKVNRSETAPKEITKDFYYNIDLVRSIQFGIVGETTKFDSDAWDDLGDWKYITFSGITVDYHVPVYLTLVFNEYGMGEYDRIIRVIEGDKA